MGRLPACGPRVRGFRDRPSVSRRRESSWGERLGEGVSAGSVVVSGNHLPNPLPPRVRRHSSTAQTPAKRVRRSTEHARGSRRWQCRLRGTPGPAPGDRPRRPPDGNRVTPQSHHPRDAHCSASPRRPGARRRTRTRPGRPRPSPPPPGPRPAWSAGRGSDACPNRPPSWRTAHPWRCRTPRSRSRRAPPPPAASCSAGPNARPPTGPRGAQEQSHGGGRAPVERPNPAHPTVCFQPTSHPCRFLGELADQPPCHQARRDHAVRFHPIGTGHEREAHFPARPGGGTLRDRMLPAKRPCRHSAGWSTCHDGTTKRSRFDLGCRRLGTRARPRGNVQERQARKDQEDANTEGGLAS